MKTPDVVFALEMAVKAYTEIGNNNCCNIDFENKIIYEKIKLFFLCNLYNPVGRVWTESVTH
ncbi:MAG: hypothetical protein NC177_13110 [Ruminococcus flavefaciens]|nr:hypothetical protein [Ruminococcus flavefaciens]